jgi:hypothetical protein
MFRNTILKIFFFLNGVNILSSTNTIILLSEANTIVKQSNMSLYMLVIQFSFFVGSMFSYIMFPNYIIPSKNFLTHLNNFIFLTYTILFLFPGALFYSINQTHFFIIFLSINNVCSGLLYSLLLLLSTNDPNNVAAWPYHGITFSALIASISMVTQNYGYFQITHKLLSMTISFVSILLSHICNISSLSQNYDENKFYLIKKLYKECAAFFLNFFLTFLLYPSVLSSAHFINNSFFSYKTLISFIVFVNFNFCVLLGCFLTYFILKLHFINPINLLLIYVVRLIITFFLFLFLGCSKCLIPFSIFISIFAILHSVISIYLISYCSIYNKNNQSISLLLSFFSAFGILCGTLFSFFFFYFP